LFLAVPFEQKPSIFKIGASPEPRRQGSGCMLNRAQMGPWGLFFTLWWTNIAMENGYRNSGFSHQKWWFSIAMLVHQRVMILPSRLETNQGT
jgi:hypothetical protein